MMSLPSPDVIARRKAEDQKVVSALRSAGIEVGSVYDLVNDPQSFPAAVEPLLRMLPEIEEPVIKEGIVRALTDKAARGIAAKPLVEELRWVRDTGEDLYGGTVCNALTVVADKSARDDLLDLARDPRVKALKTTRSAIADVLAAFKKDELVIDVLVEMLQDEETAGAAIRALRKLDARQARSYVEPYISHPEAWVRNEAKKALARFDQRK